MFNSYGIYCVGELLSCVSEANDCIIDYKLGCKLQAIFVQNVISVS